MTTNRGKRTDRKNNNRYRLLRVNHCNCVIEERSNEILRVNIQSSFTVQNPRAQLVKIEHVILLYLSSANSDSALLTITHKNRALLTMASADLQK